MNKVLKWILGIVIGAIVVGALVTAGFFIFNHQYGSRVMMETRDFSPWGNERLQPRQYMPMHPYGRMPGSRFPVFSPLAFIAGGLLRLGLLALVVIGVIALVRVLWRPRPAAVLAQPAAAPSEQVAPLTSACPNCGFAVREGWKHCPNCAQDLNEQTSE